MKFKGTKGKWYSVEYAGNYILQSGDKYGDKNILDAENVNQEAKYNALLAIKSPEMLDFLIRLRDEWQHDDLKYGGENYHMNEITNLIKEATTL